MFSLGNATNRSGPPAPGLTSLSLRPTEPYIGFCIISASVAHGKAALPALDVDRAKNAALREDLESSLLAYAACEASHIYQGGCPSFIRQDHVKGTSVFFLGQVRITISTFAFGATEEERQANAERMLPEHYPHADEDEEWLLIELKRCGRCPLIDIETIFTHDPNRELSAWSV